MLSSQRPLDFDQSSVTSGADSWATAPSTPDASRAASLSRTHSIDSHSGSRSGSTSDLRGRPKLPSRRPSNANSDVSDREGTAWATLPMPSADRLIRLPTDEFRVPPRLPQLSAAASHSAVSTPPDSPREPPRRLLATASMQHLSGSSSTNTAYSAARARSGSMASSVTAKRRATESEDRDVTIAVVGAGGVGKSTFIRKGTKHYNLEPNPVALTAPRGLLGSSSPVNYSRYVGRVEDVIIDDEVFPFARTLHAIEINIGSLQLENDPDSSAPMVFPASAGPHVDGVMICYDASNAESFTHVESLIRRIRPRRIPFMVLALKSDLQEAVNERATFELLKKYDSGLALVSTKDSVKKHSMRMSFDWILKAVFRERRGVSDVNQPAYRNPASPSVIEHREPPWDLRTGNQPPLPNQPLETRSVSSHALSSPTSPTRTRSTSDLPTTAEEQAGRPSTSSAMTIVASSVEQSNGEASPTTTEIAEPETRQEPAKPERKSGANFATVAELLDRLLWVAVTGDDPTFLQNFLLTYRRFTTPRTILLAMIKRVNDLDTPRGDVMFGAFCQMRVCGLLEMWLKEFPGDFVVRGAPEALNSFVNMVRKRIHLIHYAGIFIPQLELVSSNQDKDSAWALPESAYGDNEEDIHDDLGPDIEAADPLRPRASTVDEHPPQDRAAVPRNSRERSGSLPAPTRTPSIQHAHKTKQQIDHLSRLATEINALDSKAIAQEITRYEAAQFMRIKPRHWLHYVFVSSKKDREQDTITQFNVMSNNLASWVVSIILSHDKVKSRARQIEKFVEIALEVRNLHNYSALRAIVAGINNATQDEAMGIFKAKNERLAKSLMSWDLLLDSSRSHRRYRLALKHVDSACIPALEVHMSDLIRAQQANADRDGERIHWGKFNMMGKFINTTTQCQVRILSKAHNSAYDIQENLAIQELVFKRNHFLMSTELQEQRIANIITFEEELIHPHVFSGISREREATSPSAKSEGQRFKKLFSRDSIR